MNQTDRKTSQEDLEHKAYEIASKIPTVEPNDQIRLGYHVYLFLDGFHSNVDEILDAARARLTILYDEAKKRLEELLQENNTK